MYRSNPFCSTKTPGLNMWKHLWTRKRENPKTRKREESTRGRENGENAKTAKTRKRRKQENRENGENAKTRKRRKPENGENDENPKTAKSVPVFWFSISRFLVFSVFWFSRFLVFSFRWPHPSGQVAFFMCLAERPVFFFHCFHVQIMAPLPCMAAGPIDRTWHFARVALLSGWVSPKRYSCQRVHLPKKTHDAFLI